MIGNSPWPQKAAGALKKYNELQDIAKAEQAEILLDNPQTFLKFEESITSLKVYAMKSALQLQGWADEIDAYNKRVADSANKHGTTIQGTIKKVWDAFKSFTDGLKKVGAQIRGQIGEWVQIGRDMVLGLARGIKNSAGEAWSAIKGVMAGAVNYAKKQIDSHSPSRVFMEIGDYIGEGLAIGIGRGAHGVAAATGKLTEAARQSAQEVSTLLQRLFPELEQADKYRRDLALLAGAGLSESDLAKAQRRLNLEATGTGGAIDVTAATITSRWLRRTLSRRPPNARWRH